MATAAEVKIDEAALTELEASFGGEIVGPESPSYDEHRRVWNGSIDRRPALIARCAGVADVIRAVEFGRQTGRPVAVRSGGHSFPGLSTWDDALLIDLGRMKGIRVDPDGGTAGVRDRDRPARGLRRPGRAKPHRRQPPDRHPRARGSLPAAAAASPDPLPARRQPHRRERRPRLEDRDRDRGRAVRLAALGRQLRVAEPVCDVASGRLAAAVLGCRQILFAGRRPTNLPAVIETAGNTAAEATVSPELSVRRGREAVEFYKAVFGAVEVHRVGGTDENEDVVAQLSVGNASFWVSDESPPNENFSPESLGGSTVRLLLIVQDPHAVVERAVALGAREVRSVEEAHGWLFGRIEDPFGHHWEIGKPLVEWPPPQGGG